MKALLFFSSFFLLLPALGAGEVQFNAKVSTQEMGANEPLTLTLEVSKEGSGGKLDIEDVSFEALDFEVAGTSKSSSMASLYEGGRFQVRRIHRYLNTLYPKKSGNLKITRIQAKVNGQNLKVKDISVQVRPGTIRKNPTPRPQPPSQGSPRITSPLPASGNGPMRLLYVPEGTPPVFAAVDVSKKTAYMGEEIHVKFWGYTRVTITDFSVSNWPNLPGFWKEELGLKAVPKFAQIPFRGLMYNRALLAEYVVFPIKPGKEAIDSIVIQGMARYGQQQRRRGWGFSPPRGTAFKKHSQVVPIKVLALPALPDGWNFSSVVGPLTVSMSGTTSKVTSNEPFEIQVRLQGGGNLRAIENIAPDLPEGFELFDTKKEVQFRPGGRSTALFRHVIIPRKTGKFEIPGLKTSRFDPQEKKYIQIRTQSIPLTVQGDGSTPPMPETDPPKEEAGEVIPLSPLSGPQSSRSPFSLSLVFWIIGTLLSGYWVSKVLQKKWVKSDGYLKKQVWKDYLLAKRDLEALLKEKDSSKIEKSLKEMMAKKMSVQEAQITFQSLEGSPLENFVPILKELDSIAFGGGKHELNQETLDALQENLSLLAPDEE